MVINLIMSSAFAAILIYAMELMPGRMGLVGGFFYGLSFGLGGIAAALLGEMADRSASRRSIGLRVPAGHRPPRLVLAGSDGKAKVTDARVIVSGLGWNASGKVNICLPVIVAI